MTTTPTTSWIPDLDLPNTLAVEGLKYLISKALRKWKGFELSVVLHLRYNFSVCVFVIGKSQWWLPRFWTIYWFWLKARLTRLDRRLLPLSRMFETEGHRCIFYAHRFIDTVIAKSRLEDLRSSNRILTFSPQVMPSQAPPDRSEHPEIPGIDPSLPRIDLDWYVHKDEAGNDFAAAEAGDRTYVIGLEGPYPCVASVIVHKRSEKMVGRFVARWYKWGFPRTYWTTIEAKLACEQNAFECDSKSQPPN